MTTARRPLLLATTNPHKIEEFRAIFANLSTYRLVAPFEVGLRLAVTETGTTFAANAAIKARAYADASGMLALADDSGIEIDALGGAPGIYSARWAGADVSYPQRCRILLQRLCAVPAAQRTARYRCAIAVAAPTPVGVVGVVEGAVAGRIAEDARGSGGFGYDPIFYLPELGRTLAEVAAEQKHAISHRARAATAARALLARLAVEGAAAPADAATHTEAL